VIARAKGKKLELIEAKDAVFGIRDIFFLLHL
jgi:hypothetical protein